MEKRGAEPPGMEGAGEGGGGARLGLAAGAAPALGDGSDAVSVCPPLCGALGKPPFWDRRCVLETFDFFKRIYKHLQTGWYFPLALKLKGTFISLLSPSHREHQRFLYVGLADPILLLIPFRSALRTDASSCISSPNFMFTKTICRTQRCLCRRAGPREGAFPKSQPNSCCGCTTAGGYGASTRRFRHGCRSKWCFQFGFPKRIQTVVQDRSGFWPRSLWSVISAGLPRVRSWFGRSRAGAGGGTPGSR